MPVDFKIEFGSEDSFILTTYKDDKEIKIRLDLRIMPKEVADKSKVGEARDDPNREPFLPPPAGRIKFSLNPFTMLVSFFRNILSWYLHIFCFFRANSSVPTSSEKSTASYAVSSAVYCASCAHQWSSAILCLLSSWKLLALGEQDVQKANII